MKLLLIVCSQNTYSCLILNVLIIKLPMNKIKHDVLVKFGNRIRALRKQKGMSQEELAFKAGLHRTYIGMIERAEKNITLLNIQKIAQALEIPVKELFDETR